MLIHYKPPLQWLHSRIWLKKIAALWGLLLLSCVLAKTTQFHSWIAIVHLSILSLLLITLFRLWDDLADREFDQRHHPERILATLKNGELMVFYGFGGLLLPLLALLLYFFIGVTALMGFALLCGFIAIVYSLLPTLTPLRPLRNALVILKYPAMLILLTGGQLNLRTGLIALGLYSLLLVYECYEYLKKRHDNTT